LALIEHVLFTDGKFSGSDKKGTTQAPGNESLLNSSELIKILFKETDVLIFPELYLLMNREDKGTSDSSIED